MQRKSVHNFTAFYDTCRTRLKEDTMALFLVFFILFVRMAMESLFL